jgi:hypothetical protein
MEARWLALFLAGCGRIGFDARPDDATAPSIDADPLAQYDDSFDGNALDPSWQVLNGSQLGMFVVRGGSLVLEQNLSGGYWYNTGQGPFVFKLLTGDMMVTTILHMSAASNLTQPPPAPTWGIAGIMARNATTIENWVWIGIGTPNGLGTIGGEHKTTVASATTITDFAWTSPTAHLRLCRVADHFSVLDETGGTWNLEQDYVRPDLPAQLQIGMMIGVYSGPADLHVEFDDITFRTPLSLADCANP